MRLYETEQQHDDLLKVYPHVYFVEIEGHKITVFSDMDIPYEEAKSYADRGYKHKFNKYLREIALHFDGEYVDISYGTDPMPGFDRIRRITGYLVGTLDRFNDAKKAEESERVKHGVHDKH